MFRCLFALVLSQLAIADIVDLTSSATWSFTSTGSHGPDAAFAFGQGATKLIFRVSLPANAVISQAVLDLSQSTDIEFPGIAPQGCQPPATPVIGFFQEDGCSDLIARIPNSPFPDAFYQDQITISASGTNFSTLFGPPPFSIDPGSIPLQGTYSVSLLAEASMVFTNWLDPNNIGNTPPIPSFSGTSHVSGILEIESSAAPVPEPTSYRSVLAGSLLVLIICVVYRSRSTWAYAAHRAGSR